MKKNTFETAGSQEPRPQTLEEIQKIRLRQKEEAEAVMKRALEVAQRVVAEIDPDLSVELIPSNSMDGTPDLGVFYRKGQQGGGMLGSYEGPRVNNEGAMYRPGGAWGDFESGKFEHSFKQYVEEDMRKARVGKFRDFGMTPERIEERDKKEAYERFMREQK